MLALILALIISGTIEMEDEVKLIAPTEEIHLDSVEFHANQDVYIEGKRIVFENGGRFYGPKFHFKAKEGIYTEEERLYDMEFTEWMGTGVTITNLGEKNGTVTMRGASMVIQKGLTEAVCSNGGYLTGTYFASGTITGGIVFHNVILEGEHPEPTYTSPTPTTSPTSSSSMFSCIWDCFEQEEAAVEEPEEEVIEEEPEEETPAETYISENIKPYIH